MDASQTEIHQINETNCRLVTNNEESLPFTLEKDTQEIRLCRNHYSGYATASREKGKSRSEESTEEDKQREKGAIKEQKDNVVAVLQELTEFHSEILTHWRKAIREFACMLEIFPQGGDEDRSDSTKEYKTKPCLDSTVDILLSVGEDIDNIMERVTKTISKLHAAVLQLSQHEDSAAAEVFEESRHKEASDQPKDIRKPQSESNLELKDDVHDIVDQKYMLDSGFNSLNWSEENKTEGESHIRGQGRDFQSHVSLLEEEDYIEENNKERSKEEKWNAVRLTDQMDDSDKPTDACFIRAPAGTLRCEVADALSCLMVSSSEELVSRVIRINTQDRHSFPFPVTLAVPFCVRHRSSHREVAVKLVDEEKRVSYITPVTTDGAHGGQQGCFAEVKVYSLGIFAVVSRLKSEMYIVPKRGLSLKLPMDPRISLDYLPRSFTAPVMAQIMVEPMDAILLAAIKSRNDAYELVVSVSPLLHLTHPKTQPLRRPLTIMLPCPPNPEKKDETRRKENQEHQGWVPSHFLSPTNKVSILGAYLMKSYDRSKELLIVLGSRDKEWCVLDKTVVRNQQNGLVSFNLFENFDRLLVFRLLSPLQPCHLTALAEELEVSARLHTVTIYLRCGRDDPHSVLLVALPSRDLSLELNRLRAHGWDGLIETSSEILLCEGDQLLLYFTGNITSAASTQSNTSEDPHERLTFHCQRKNELSVRLREVDPFGNYSSPCYKGTALLYRVNRAELEWRGDKAVLRDAKLLDPLSDSLLLWLSGELSQEETALLVSFLHLSHSSAQLVKLRFRDSPADQAFHILNMWRRALPAVECHPKTSQLAQSLTKIGRPDLAREVMLRVAELSDIESLRK